MMLLFGFSVYICWTWVLSFILSCLDPILIYWFFESFYFHFIIFFSDFKYLFLCPVFGLTCSCLVKIMRWIFIWDFSDYFNISIYTYKLPLSNHFPCIWQFLVCYDFLCTQLQEFWNFQNFQWPWFSVTHSSFSRVLLNSHGFVYIS